MSRACQRWRSSRVRAAPEAGVFERRVHHGQVVGDPRRGGVDRSGIVLGDGHHPGGGPDSFDLTRRRRSSGPKHQPGQGFEAVGHPVVGPEHGRRRPLRLPDDPLR